MVVVDDAESEADGGKWREWTQWTATMPLHRLSPWTLCVDTVFTPDRHCKALDRVSSHPVQPSSPIERSLFDPLFHRTVLSPSLLRQASSSQWTPTCRGSPLSSIFTARGFAISAQRPVSNTLDAAPSFNHSSSHALKRPRGQAFVGGPFVNQQQVLTLVRTFSLTAAIYSYIASRSSCAASLSSPARSHSLNHIPSISSFHLI